MRVMDGHHPARTDEVSWLRNKMSSSSSGKKHSPVAYVLPVTFHFIKLKFQAFLFKAKVIGFIYKVGVVTHCGATNLGCSQ